MKPEDVEQQYQRRREWIRRLRRKFGLREQDAADVVQDTMVKVIRHRLPVANPSGFFWTSLTNAALDLLQSGKEQKQGEIVSIDDVTESALADPRSPARQCEAEQEIELVLRLPPQFTPLCRQAFQLVRLQGLTCEEAARRLNIPRWRVEKFVARVLQYHGERRDDVGERK